jgi:hypothetical protein
MLKSIVLYSYAVNLLIQCWKYGEALHKCYNKEWGYEGDGIVNSSILTVNIG